MNRLIRALPNARIGLRNSVAAVRPLTAVSIARPIAASISRPRFLSSAPAAATNPKSDGGNSGGSSGSAKPPRRRLWPRVLLAGGAAFGLFLALSENPEYRFMRVMPLRALSRAWGALNGLTLPEFMRAPIYRLWLRVFNGNESEVRDPLNSYVNLGEFFIRYLVPGCRTMHSDALVSPVDGKITVFGDVTPNGMVDQVKGVSYPVHQFLGYTPAPTKLHYCVLYLAPGDYHRMHAPTDCVFTSRRHFSGELYPVLPSIAKHVPGLFALNERIVLSGRWKYGYFSFSPVGAYNVGSIRLNAEPELLTNQSEQRPQLDTFTKSYADMQVDKGAEIARFELGSTVVLVFEVSSDNELEWTVGENQTIRLGQSLARVVPKKNKSAAAPAPAAATNSATAASPDSGKAFRM